MSWSAQRHVILVGAGTPGPRLAATPVREVHLVALERHYRAPSIREVRLVTSFQRVKIRKENRPLHLPPHAELLVNEFTASVSRQHVVTALRAEIGGAAYFVTVEEEADFKRVVAELVRRVDQYAAALRTARTRLPGYDLLGARLPPARLWKRELVVPVGGQVEEK